MQSWEACPVCGWTGHQPIMHGGLGYSLAGALGDHRHTTPSEFYVALAQHAGMQQRAALYSLQNAYVPPDYDVDELNHATRLEF